MVRRYSTSQALTSGRAFEHPDIAMIMHGDLKVAATFE
jgi:hypothetical protein